MAAESTVEVPARSLSDWLPFLAAALFAGALVAAAGGMAWSFLDYYRLDHAGQLAHDMHDVAGPAGFVGLWAGVLGTALMLAMLSYSVRKKLLGAAWLGPIRHWLIFHIICGVMGPVFIVLHGGVRPPTGLISFGFWFMVAVALSGLFGRYVYGFFPRTAQGFEVDLGTAAKDLATLRARLVEQTADAKAEPIGRAVVLAGEVDMEVDSVLSLLRFEVEVRRRARAIREALDDAELPDDARDAAEATLLRQLQLRRSVETWAMSKRMFRYWHLFHLPLAKVMYLIIVLHVAFAMLFGGALQTLFTAPG